MSADVVILAECFYRTAARAWHEWQEDQNLVDFGTHPLALPFFRRGGLHPDPPHATNNGYGAEVPTLCPSQRLPLLQAFAPNFVTFDEREDAGKGIVVFLGIKGECVEPVQNMYSNSTCLQTLCNTRWSAWRSFASQVAP